MKKLLIACMIIAGMGIFTGCGEQTPTQAFKEWRNAIISGKIDAANKLTADEQSLNSIFAEAVKDNEAEGKVLKSGTIVSEDVKGDKAVIKMKGSDGKTTDFIMVKSQGKWKISHKGQK